MIRMSKKPVEWPAPWDPETIVLIRPGDVIERADFEGEMAGEHRAGRVFGFQFAEAFAGGVKTLLADAPDDAARILDLAASEEGGEALDEAEAAVLADAREAVAEHWPAYRALVATDARRRALLPVVAFRRFCCGWQGTDMPAFRQGPDGRVPLELMGEIDALLVQGAGLAAYRMLYARGQEGNSARPSKSGEGPATSTSGVICSPPTRTADHPTPPVSGEAANPPGEGGSSLDAPQAKKRSSGTGTRSSPSRTTSSPSSTCGSTAAAPAA